MTSVSACLRRASNIADAIRFCFVANKPCLELVLRDNFPGSLLGECVVRDTALEHGNEESSNLGIAFV